MKFNMYYMLPTTTYLFWIIFGIPRESDLYSLRIQTKYETPVTELFNQMLQRISSQYLIEIHNEWIRQEEV